MAKLAVKPEPVEVTDEELEAQLPTPVGYHLLVAMPEVEDTYDSTSILKSVTTKNHEAIMSIIGLVLVISGKEYRLMNDDSIEATVKDPRGVSRA